MGAAVHDPSCLEVLLTYSGHRALGPAAKAGLPDCIANLIDGGYGGRITKRYLTELRVASTPGVGPPTGAGRYAAR